MNFDHFILTPFNLDSPKWKSQVYLDDIWMQTRLDIFKNVTVPSVLSQTNTNFKWLVAFDAKTPQKWRSEIMKMDTFYIIFTRRGPKTWVDMIKTFKEHDAIITTRLDSDDAIHEDFIETVQRKFNGLNNGYLNFLNGLMTDGKYVYNHKHKSSPFSSLKTNDPNKHIRMLKHTQVRNQENFQQIHNETPLWLIYLHGKNTSERIPEDRDLTTPDRLKGFHINLPITGEAVD